MVGEEQAFIEQHNYDSLLLVCITYMDYQPNQFVVSQLKSTDKLKIIQSEELKKLLYDWELQLYSKTETFKMWDTYFMTLLIPYLDEHASISNMDAGGGFPWSSPSPLESNTVAIFNDLHFDNHLENYTWCTWMFEQSLDELREIAEGIRAEIASNN